MKIDKTLIEKLAKLSQLDFSEEAKSKMEKDLRPLQMELVMSILENSIS